MKSIWNETSAANPRYPALSGEIACDVAVVGGGITGLTAALLLRRAGLSVALIERGRVGGGDTGLTTAHLTAALDTRYHVLIRRFGHERAGLAAAASRAAIDLIGRLVRELDIACGFSRVPGYLFAERADGIGELRREHGAARALGLAASLTRDVPLPFDAVGALRFEDQAQFHPGDYLLALAAEFSRIGGTIFEDTPLLEAHEAADSCRLEVPGGEIFARDVVFATHGGMPGGLAFQTRVAHYRTYAMSFDLGARPMAPGLFWDLADPYHYLRTQAFGDENFLIVGGNDHKTGVRGDLRDCFHHLREYVRLRFGREIADAETHRWSGQVLLSVDGLPYIGRAPFSKRTFVATGFAGNGMTFGSLSGMLIADLLVGTRNPAAELFSPSRIKPLASARAFLQENKDYPIHMVRDRLTGPSRISVQRIRPGEGRVTWIGSRRAAVYRDEAGDLHAVSPVCPHMGCLVRFNSAEKTWDCPCHGSRFATDGGVLGGPARRGLEPMELGRKAPEKKRREAA